MNTNITIGYLSWKKTNVLLNTLESHKNNGLFDIIPPQNRCIFFQEFQDQDTRIAEKYNLHVLKNKENIGILNAFIELIENCNTKYFIFCENDFVLMKNNFYIKQTIEDVCNILDNDEYGVVKLSNSKNPGFLYIKGGDSWLQGDQTSYKYKAESLSWIPNPKDFYKNIKTILHNYEWFVFNKDDQLWSNHIYACNTKYLLNVVIPLLKFNRDNNPNLDVKYQGLEDTLNFTDNIPNQNDFIKHVIDLHNKRNIYSGGGNFYHNKIG
jgi:hypothetical protein